MANSASGASEDSTEPYWKGNRIDEIYRGLGQFELQHLPPIEHNEKHKVLFELPINSSEDQPPKPHAGKTKWDSNHVRLPCAAQNTINIDGEVSITVEYYNSVSNCFGFHLVWYIFRRSAVGMSLRQLYSNRSSQSKSWKMRYWRIIRNTWTNGRSAVCMI